jgi:hypothetical protein
MIRRRSAIKSLFIAILISIFLANGAQAADPIRNYQIDVVPISNPGTTINVTEEVSRQIIAQVDLAFNDATDGQIRFTFRKLHPTSFPDMATLSSGDIQKATGLTPVADPGFDKAILVGVIPKSSAVNFAGQAVLGGNYIIMNGNWTLNSTGPGVLAHELGHSLGISHANSAVCTTQLPIVCEQDEYGDFSSVMGTFISKYVTNPLISRFSATELDELKVLPKESRAFAPVSGDYKIAPAYSKGINLPKVLYIPIGSELTYSVEYRPAIGNDSGLSMSKLQVPGVNSFYTNTPSHGLQLRMLPIKGTQFKDSQPTHSKYQIDGTALIVSAFTADQVQPIGKVFTLSDGSTITFLSADPNTGATVRVERSPDKEPPIVSNLRLGWIAKSGLVQYFPLERNILKNNLNEWEYPTVDIPLDAIMDNRLIKTIEVEVNGEIVGQVDQPLLNGIKSYAFKTTKPGTFTFRLIGTDYAGLSTSTAAASLTSTYFQLEKPYTQIEPGKDPRTSLFLSVERSSEKTKYALEKLSSGKITSIVEGEWEIGYTITNIARNQKFTAQLSGTDNLGYTDGGTEINYEPETTECTNKQCFVGYQWNVETGFWATGAGNMTLQERIGTKWVNIQTAKPVADPKGAMKNYVTYLMKINHKTTGKHTYRFSIAASKKYSAQITSTFTQVVSTP